MTLNDKINHLVELTEFEAVVYSVLSGFTFYAKFYGKPFLSVDGKRPSGSTFEDCINNAFSSTEAHILR